MSKIFRMPSWFISKAGEETPSTTPERKYRRLQERKPLWVRRKDVVKFYMNGRRLNVICANAQHEEPEVIDESWFFIGKVITRGEGRILVYNGPVFSMVGGTSWEKFSKLRNAFPDFTFDALLMTLTSKEGYERSTDAPAHP